MNTHRKVRTKKKLKASEKVSSEITVALTRLLAPVKYQEHETGNLKIPLCAI